MKEIRQINLSDNKSNNMFDIEMVHDNIYEWTIKLMKVDPESGNMIFTKNKPITILLKTYPKIC